MAGHLFTACGDITRLHCDAWLLPTDTRGLVEPSWLWHGPRHLRPEEGDPQARFVPNAADEIRRLESGNPTTTAQWPDQPRPYLVPIGRRRSSDVGAYLRHAIAGIDLAVAELDGAPTTKRERPLIAVPLLGIGAGGLAEDAGALIAELVDGLRRHVTAHAVHFDLALVAYDLDAFAACQQVRRREEFAAASTSEDMERLTLAANRGALVTFVGAGVSAGAGLPDWTGLLEQLAVAAGYSESERKRLGNVDALDRARLVASRLREMGTTLGAEVAKLTGQGRYGLVHSQLACLPVQEVTTTNYDELFEFAARDAGAPVTVLPYERLAGRGRWLLKLHGCVKHEDDIVLTREDYYDYDGRRGALRGIVQALLITRHMLFVGFSLRDDNFLRIAHEVRTAVRQTSGTKPDPYGTVLTLFDDPMRADLRNDDLHVWAIGEEAPEDRESELAAVKRNARRQEILLDELLVRCTASAGHLLDTRFAGALDANEMAARRLLKPLLDAANTAPADSPTWTKIRGLLSDLGGETAVQATKDTSS